MNHPCKIVVLILIKSGASARKCILYAHWLVFTISAASAPHPHHTRTDPHHTRTAALNSLLFFLILVALLVLELCT